MVIVNLIRKAVCIIIALIAAGLLYDLGRDRTDTTGLMLIIFAVAGTLVYLIYP